MATNVLFLCPHAAAKSVFAMTYFQDLATQSGLDVRVDNAGTDPDAEINPKVEAYLKAEGYNLAGFIPSLLTSEHLQVADIVVSMGCLSPEQMPENVRYVDWSDVPMLSEDFQVAHDKIYEHVVKFVADLKA